MKRERLYNERILYKKTVSMNNKTKASEKLPFIHSDSADHRLNINDYVVENKTATYFVRVKGDSMQGVGIYDKDILVVDKSKQITCGKIIVATLNGEFTIKRLIIKNGRKYLFSEHPKYPTISITNECDFEVFGVVTYTIHKPL
ncbi:MAG: LexA repressor [Chlamydiia bacterium]|nr:LexA repressor [Chlamydiia bacterium]MCH9618356.1 LexA repressor [Chlamydiia bacterium]MCH9624222.1 LexA repressor [Chlamydiia bacterium]